MIPNHDIHDYIKNIYQELSDHVDEIVRLKRALLMVRVLVHVIIFLNIILFIVILFK